MTAILRGIWDRVFWKFMLPDEQIIRLRKKGMALIKARARRLAKSTGPWGAIEARWESELSWLDSPVVEDRVHTLAFISSIHGAGHFPDWVVVLYPRDPEGVAQVEKELQRVIEAMPQ